MLDLSPTRTRRTVLGYATGASLCCHATVHRIRFIFPVVS